ncbi:hypothetical protein [Streptomyces mirabilis]|uniref:hypothetical protein n=1 Tax=Streptomyces mirabilis TaxID=68239 RepID=UPI00224CBC2E|nr:hypothetical protein [Streptomyces mirabilis]MCX4617839.1 hypothetical protein [Streptomyces mirabilis]
MGTTPRALNTIGSIRGKKGSEESDPPLTTAWSIGPLHQVTARLACPATVK